MFNKIKNNTKQKTLKKTIYKKIKNYAKEILKFVDKRLPHPLFYKVHTFEMSKEEIILFDQTIKNADNYLEFGLGGSTIHALLKSNATVYTMDTSKSWIDELREYLFI